MSFQPETDSEDELPPGWEERATLGNYYDHSFFCEYQGWASCKLA